MVSPRLNAVLQPIATNNMSDTNILLSAFADEAANHKTAIEQFSVLAALGLKHYSPRFVDVVGSGALDAQGNEIRTPEGVRNNAKSIFRLPMIAEGFSGRAK